MIMQSWKELSRLKRALSVFFVIEQFRKRPDPRYDGFFASIIKQSIKDMPEISKYFLGIMTINSKYLLSHTQEMQE